MVISVAESCTAADRSRLTDARQPRYVDRGVPQQRREDGAARRARDWCAHGAVSEPVALAMAADRVESGSSRVGVTGIAGPGGGTPGSRSGPSSWPLSRPGVAGWTFRFMGERLLVKFQASQAALDPSAVCRRAVRLFVAVEVGDAVEQQRPALIASCARESIVRRRQALLALNGCTSRSGSSAK